MVEVEMAGAEPQFNVISEVWTSSLRSHFVTLQNNPHVGVQFFKSHANIVRKSIFHDNYYDLMKANLSKMVTTSNNLLPAELVKSLRTGDKEAMTSFLASDVVTVLCADITES